MLRKFKLEERKLDPHHTWRDPLSSVAFAIRVMYHMTLATIPAQRVLGRETILPFTLFRVNWEVIRRERQYMTNR